MQKPVRWSLLTLVCAVMLIAFFSYRNWIHEEIGELEQQTAALTVTLSRMRAETTELEEAIERVGTDADIEEKARAQYGFMKDGELRFEVNNPEMLDAYTEEEKLILSQELGP